MICIRHLTIIIILLSVLGCLTPSQKHGYLFYPYPILASGYPNGYPFPIVKPISGYPLGYVSPLLFPANSFKGCKGGRFK